MDFHHTTFTSEKLLITRHFQANYKAFPDETKPSWKGKY